MSNEKIQELLARLHKEVQKTEVDDDTRSALHDLDSDIHNLLSSSTPEPNMTFVMQRPARSGRENSLSFGPLAKAPHLLKSFATPGSTKLT